MCNSSSPWHRTMVEPAVENPFILDLSDTYGLFLASVASSCALWGISCMQLFMYASDHGDDSIILQSLVYSSWIINTVGEALAIATIWWPLVKRWGSLEELGTLRGPLLHRVWTGVWTSIPSQASFRRH
ncbi:hypothetical protein C8Q76DRAFT_177410 [Earliella scabrosa]|nr:hypothetical protein C8Q76DRAFT_177410 [Earliella scabrosa]